MMTAYLKHLNLAFLLYENWATYSAYSAHDKDEDNLYVKNLFAICFHPFRNVNFEVYFFNVLRNYKNSVNRLCREE